MNKLTSENLAMLFDLLRCHATPGDEDEVRDCLIGQWGLAGLEIKHHGAYAISANVNKSIPDRPILLICAHMDSPGYVVESQEEDRLKLVRLGSPRFTAKWENGMLKTREGKFPIVIEKMVDGNGVETYGANYKGPIDHGDRVCFTADPKINFDDGLLTSPFIDNRAGCFLLSHLANCPEFLNLTGINLVIGATACEEVGCLGAPVLACARNPDYVICLDATYDNASQNVHLGKGPVLTLTDASVLLSCRVRDRLAALFQDHRIPLQTEVYNYSGTDARAFPKAGLPAQVLALLIASSGNHTPCETIAVTDLDWWYRGVRMLIHAINTQELRL